MELYYRGGVIMKQRVNWTEAREYYLSNETVSFQDVAKEFNAAHITVRVKAAKEKWYPKRKVILHKATELMLEQLPERIAESIFRDDNTE